MVWGRMVRPARLGPRFELIDSVRRVAGLVPRLFVAV